MSLLEPPQDIITLLRESFDASVIGSAQTTAAAPDGVGDVNEEGFESEEDCNESAIKEIMAAGGREFGSY